MEIEHFQYYAIELIDGSKLYAIWNPNNYRFYAKTGKYCLQNDNKLTKEIVKSKIAMSRDEFNEVVNSWHKNYYKKIEWKFDHNIFIRSSFYEDFIDFKNNTYSKDGLLYGMYQGKVITCKYYPNGGGNGDCVHIFNVYTNKFRGYTDIKNVATIQKL